MKQVVCKINDIPMTFRATQCMPTFNDSSVRQVIFTRTLTDETNLPADYFQRGGVKGVI